VCNYPCKIVCAQCTCWRIIIDMLSFLNMAWHFIFILWQHWEKQLMITHLHYAVDFTTCCKGDTSYRKGLNKILYYSHKHTPWTTPGNAVCVQKFWWFTKLYILSNISHFAAFFIIVGTKTSTTENCMWKLHFISLRSVTHKRQNVQFCCLFTHDINW
jgi:hypothetical protein